MPPFAALADDHRVRIVEALAGGECSVNQLVDMLPISQPAVSRHLRILREAGLVQSRSDGQRRIYVLDPRPLVELDEWLTAQRREWTKRLDALGRHLDRMGGRGRKVR